MIIKSVRIKNYRSINDSGDIYLEEDITAMAGKNESGKTAILEALEDFDKKNKIRIEARPLHNENAIPEIRVALFLSVEELNSLLKQSGLKTEFKNGKTLTLVKEFPEKYTLDEDGSSWIKNLIDEDIKKIVNEIKRQLTNSIKLANKTEGINIELPNINSEDEKFDETINGTTKQIQDSLPSVEEAERDKVTKFIQQVPILIEQLKTTKSKANKFVELIVEATPNFIYFDAFDDMLEFELPIDKVRENKAMQDFISVAGIKLEILKDAERTHQQKTNHLLSHSTEITGDFLDFWSQDRVEVTIMLNGNNLTLGFKEDGRSEIFTMEQRSKGFQWFLSFYVQLKLHHQQKTQNYLLVDEPGSYLHAKAQRDVLHLLENMSSEMPVIFTTHSPYLLDPDKLNRIKLVSRNSGDGTKVESKIHKSSDRESLTPILTAIGLEMTSGIADADKQNNVIVEGPSDWYYLTAFKEILDKKSLNFIYGGGSGNMGKVGTILQGWGCYVIYLSDTDQGKKDGQRQLTRKWLVEKTQIEGISDKEGTCIEDLFTKEDFAALVLEEEKAKIENSNSEYVTKGKKDKALLAKNFLSNTNKVKDNLSEKTKEKFSKVFDTIEAEFAK